ncbi:class C sortase [Blautia sp. MSJ-19]|uniref:class C sortase n=1 Tax=Blautia sp. MSJ-19 TaxID=2841517 RepID=UPI001C0EFCFC|nr:class C sortase [Blautia sp. MSJ-19]MBU5482281.1 class C sortase [Blautia sp. MSJ-19]
MKEKIRKGFFVFGILVAVAGVGLAMYATVNNWYCEYRAGNEIENYTEVVRNTSQSVLADMKKESAAYNESLAGENEAVSSVSYDDMLAATDAIGYLEIPKLHLRLPIYEGTDEEVLAKGVGHMEQTSLPTGGTSTHCVLAGHTGLPTAKLFTHLDEMKEGDLFYIRELDEILSYKVDQISVVLPDETDELRIVEGKDYVTLLTCIPYGVNSHRLLVRGERTETPSQLSDTKDTTTGRNWHYAVLVGIMLLVLAVVFGRFKYKRRREDENK